MYGGKLGWILSAVLHLGVATLAFVGLPYLQRPLPTPPPPVAIEFVKISNKTQQQAPKEEQQQEAAEEKPQRNYAAVENVPAPAEDAVPLPDKAPPKKVTPKPKPKPKPQVSETRKLAQSVRPRAKPRPPSRLKSKRIAALIDRSIKEEKDLVKKDETKKEEKTKTEEKKEVSQFAGLRGRIATASLRDALSQKLSGCWTFPRGAKGIEQMQVTVRIWLRPDGTLSRPPEFVNAGNLNDPSRAFYRVFAESARRAVRICEPFSEASQYIGAGQKYIDFNFNGAEFAGG